jgi:hypothetical protein
VGGRLGLDARTSCGRCSASRRPLDPRRRPGAAPRGLGRARRGRLGELLAARAKDGALTAAADEGEYAVFTRRGGGAYGRRGPVLVTAPDEAALRRTLQRRAAGRGQWDAALLRERGLGLPEGAVARVALDARPLVAARGGQLRRVTWVAGLERAALTLTPLGGGLRLHARASTASLAPADVPIAGGVTPPATRGRAALVAAVRDPRQTLAFARRVTELLDPRRLDGLRRHRGGAAALRARRSRRGPLRPPDGHRDPDVARRPAA